MRPLSILALLTAACSPGDVPGGASALPEPPDASQDAPAADTGLADTGPLDTGEPLPPARLFSFAIIADPHITSPDGTAIDRLVQAVTWIDGEAAARDLRFVLVAGDVAWGTGFDACFAAFDALPIPWVPIVGDNEVQSGKERDYSDKAQPHLASLADRLPGLTLSDVPVANPDRGEDSWFLNWAFTYEGVRFVGLDWGTRIKLPFIGEGAELHDFEGGTWRWFEREVTTAPDGPDGRMVLLTHHPMLTTPGGFTVADSARFAGLSKAHPGLISTAFGGHFHLELRQEAPDDAGFEVVLTDATWDDEVAVRIVDVWRTPEGIRLEDQLVIVPYEE